MSSRKFVYLLVMAAIVCGLIAGDTAYGQKGIGALTAQGNGLRMPMATPCPRIYDKRGY